MISAATLQEWRRLAWIVNAPPKDPVGYNYVAEADARSEILQRLALEAVPALIDEVERLSERCGDEAGL